MQRFTRKGANLQSIKWQNRAVVLEMLWRNQPLARKDLAERTRLTPATLTNIVAELLDASIVQEGSDGDTTGPGRRPKMLTFSGAFGHLIGVNLSRTTLTIALFDFTLALHHVLTRPISARMGTSAADTLIALIRLAVDESGIDPAHIIGIGVSSPGPLSVEEGVIYAPPQFTEWSNLPLRKLLVEAFGLPVWLENDANANALAEHWLGAGQPYDSFIYVENHSGLGSGIILNGRLFTGAGMAAELGHISIDLHGPRCACGNYGCAELYCSGPAVIRRVRDAHAGGRSTCLTREAGPTLDRLTFGQVIQAAQRGDPLALESMQEASYALGLVLVSAINLFDPEAIIIGHEMNKAGDVCLDVIRRVIRDQAIPQAAARDNVLISALPEPIGVTGAVCRALSSLFQTPHLLLTPASTLD